jgi:hypothetical protein
MPRSDDDAVGCGKDKNREQTSGGEIISMPVILL